MTERFFDHYFALIAGIVITIATGITPLHAAPSENRPSYPISARSAIGAATKATKVEAHKPDTIIFSNGDTLTGQFQYAIAGAVTFHSDLLNLDITVPWEKIRELHSSKFVSVLPMGQHVSRKTSDEKIVRGTISVVDKQLTVVPKSGESRTFPVAKVAHVLDTTTFEHELHRTPSFWRGWNGNLNAGATIVRSTSDSTTYSGGFNLFRAIPGVSFLPQRERTSIGFSGSYGKITEAQRATSTAPAGELVVTSSIYHAGAEHDRYFSTQFYALGQTAFDHNLGQGLALQQIYGGGIGWTAIKHHKEQLDVKATVQYEEQSFTNTSTTRTLDLVGSTYTLAYMCKLPYKASFNQQLLVIPAYNTPSAFTMSENDRLTLPVYKRLSITVSTLDSYLYNPPISTAPAPINQRNSFQFTTGVSYSLR
jgi:hypothetical protein